jgi:hypothetical protein
MHPNSLANLQPRPLWKPGESGNKRGSARGYRKVLSRARIVSPEALETLITCMRDVTADWPARTKAAGMILDRAWGTEGKVDLDLTTQRVTEIVIVVERPEPAAAPSAAELPKPSITIESSPASESVD